MMSKCAKGFSFCGTSSPYPLPGFRPYTAGDPLEPRFQHLCGAPPLLSPPLTLPFLSLPFPFPFIPPLPLEVSPLNAARGLMGSAVSSPSVVWGGAPAEIELGAF